MVNNTCFAQKWQHEWPRSPIAFPNEVTARGFDLSETLFSNCPVKFSMIPPERQNRYTILQKNMKGLNAIYQHSSYLISSKCKANMCHLTVIQLSLQRSYLKSRRHNFDHTVQYRWTDLNNKFKLKEQPTHDLYAMLTSISLKSSLKYLILSIFTGSWRAACYSSVKKR